MEVALTAAMKTSLPDEVDLPEKNRPILQAAIEVGASHLLTGDRQAFGRYYGKSLPGVLVLKPSAYLLEHKGSDKDCLDP